MIPIEEFIHPDRAQALCKGAFLFLSEWGSEQEGLGKTVLVPWHLTHIVPHTPIYTCAVLPSEGSKSLPPIDWTEELRRFHKRMELMMHLKLITAPHIRRLLLIADDYVEEHRIAGFKSLRALMSLPVIEWCWGKGFILEEVSSAINTDLDTIEELIKRKKVAPFPSPPPCKTCGHVPNEEDVLL